jgi:hypothetical protein
MFARTNSPEGGHGLTSEGIDDSPEKQQSQHQRSISTPGRIFGFFRLRDRGDG